MDAVKSRLVEFLDYKGLDKSVFERMCGLANGFVDKTNARMRRTSLNAISSHSPELNTNWLMSGNGDMLNECIEPTKEQAPNSEVADLIARIDKLIEVHERDSKNIERLLTLLERSAFREEAAAG